MPESMHHTASAAGETEYIYGEAIRRGIAKDIQNLNFLVVGLGLGYIEILISSKVTGCQIQSFESDPDLRQNFLNWVNGKTDFEIYNQVCRSLKLSPDLIRSQIKSNELFLNAELNLQTTFKVKSHIICFDAFSKKTSESLWTEEFLNYFLINACDHDCIFVTYSCTSLLKRVLPEHGFVLIPKLGFEGKRDSTLAVRGGFK